MLPALIHLHIPKSAGSSHRHYVYAVLGEHRVYSYGDRAKSLPFAAEDIQNFSAAEGHRPLSFYPAGMDTLFTSVLRDPVDRALSYFSFRAAPALNRDGDWSESRLRSTDEWLSRGLEPSSLVRTLEQCEIFRADISNAQCDYLSRHGATFAGVLETLNETELVIGITERLELFNAFFRDALGFELNNTLSLNTGNRDHQHASAGEHGALSLLGELNSEDQRLYDYVRDEHAGLLQRLGDAAAIRAKLPVVNNGSNLSSPPGQYNWSPVHLLCKGIVSVTAGTDIRVPLALLNNGVRNVVFSDHGSRSCTIGWRLLDAAGAAISDAGGIAALELLVPPGSARAAIIDIRIDADMLQGGSATHIEFGIVADGHWVNAQYPLTSAWGILHHTD